MAATVSLSGAPEGLRSCADVGHTEFLEVGWQGTSWRLPPFSCNRSHERLRCWKQAILSNPSKRSNSQPVGKNWAA
jgi:hypothetical protein